MREEQSERITLQAGALRFSAWAAGRGRPVLCLHGFPDDAGTFRLQLPALAGAGYRAVAPWLRGYEPATQPGPRPRSYHPMRQVEDVVAFAESMGGGQGALQGRCHLIGHDWGAIIGQLAAVARPDLFCSLTSIAIPSLSVLQEGPRTDAGQLANSWYVFFFQLRGIAERAVARKDFAFIERLWRDWSPGFRWDPAAMASVKDTFRQPGVVRAALGCYRAFLDPFSPDTRRMRHFAASTMRVPTLAITGELDGCIATRLFDRMDPAGFPAGLRIERIEGAGHFVHQEAPERINALLLSWLTENP